MDAVYIKGRVGLDDGFYVTVAVVGLSGLGDALVQGGIIGSAGELPERYMQAAVAGTAASGMFSFSISSNLYLLCLVQISIAKAVRSSANLYVIFAWISKSLVEC